MVFNEQTCTDSNDQSAPYPEGRILDRSFHPSDDSVSKADMDYQYQHTSVPPAFDITT